MAKNNTAAQILKGVGGKQNVSHLTHCATRLRFTLKDSSLADEKTVDSISGVLGVVTQGNESFQVVIGGGVADMCAEIEELMKKGGGSSSKSESKSMSDADVKAAQRQKIKGKNKIVDSFFEFLSDSFRPIIGVLLGASLILALLNLLITFGVIVDVSDTPLTMFLNSIAQAVFYFLPVLVAYNAFKKLKIDPMVGVVCMLSLFTPYFLALGDPETYADLFANANGLQAALNALSTTTNELLNKTLTTCNICGVDVLIYTYNGNVFVPLLMAGVCGLLDRGLKKIIPSSVQLVFVPFLEMLIIAPITAVILGPISIHLGNFLSIGFSWLNTNAPFVFAIAIPLLYPFLVPLGLHWPLNALMLMNISELGYDFIQGPMGCWNFACFGATFGVLLVSLREKNKQMASVSGGALAAGLLGGISEPSLYGIHLRYKKIYSRMLPGCLAGGIVIAVLGFLFPSTIAETGASIPGVTTSAFAFTSLLTIPLFSQMWVYGISIAAAFVVPVILISMFDYRDAEQKAIMLAVGAAERLGVIDIADAFQLNTDDEKKLAGLKGDNAKSVDIIAPLAGETISLKNCGDKAFAMKALGEGIAIQTEKDSDFIKAPANAVLSSVSDSQHAFTLTTDEGIGILIHVGIDTVNTKGDGFEVLAEPGDELKAGDKIAKVNFEALKNMGYKTPVMVTIINTAQVKSVKPNNDSEKVTAKDVVIKVN